MRPESFHLRPLKTADLASGPSKNMSRNMAQQHSTDQASAAGKDNALRLTRQAREMLPQSSVTLSKQNTLLRKHTQTKPSRKRGYIYKPVEKDINFYD